MSVNETYKIACVGDSITKGYGILDPFRDSYPAVLQRLMGEQYLVRNFGVNGATVLRNTPSPYAIAMECEAALEWNPDIVLIELGANDILYIPGQEDRFILDYKCIIDAFRVQPKTQICLASLTPILDVYGINGCELKNRHQKIQELIKHIARTYSLPVVDIWTPIDNAINSRLHILQDGIHLNEIGLRIIANSLHSAIEPIIFTVLKGDV